MCFIFRRKYMREYQTVYLGFSTVCFLLLLTTRIQFLLLGRVLLFSVHK